MSGAYKLVDALSGMPSPPRRQARKLDPNIQRWFKGSKAMTEGATLDEMVAEMHLDKLGEACSNGKRLQIG